MLGLLLLTELHIVNNSCKKEGHIKTHAQSAVPFCFWVLLLLAFCLDLSPLSTMSIASLKSSAIPSCVCALHSMYLQPVLASMVFLAHSQGTNLSCSFRKSTLLPAKMMMGSRMWDMISVYHYLSHAVPFVWRCRRRNGLRWKKQSQRCRSWCMPNGLSNYLLLLPDP